MIHYVISSIAESITANDQRLIDVFTIVIVVVMFVILYIFRVRKTKSKYNPHKRHTEDIRDWGGMPTGKPIGDPK